MGQVGFVGLDPWHLRLLYVASHGGSGLCREKAQDSSSVQWVRRDGNRRWRVLVSWRSWHIAKHPAPNTEMCFQGDL